VSDLDSDEDSNSGDSPGVDNQSESAEGTSLSGEGSQDEAREATASGASGADNSAVDISGTNETEQKQDDTAKEEVPFISY